MTRDSRHPVIAAGASLRARSKARRTKSLTLLLSSLILVAAMARAEATDICDTFAPDTNGQYMARIYGCSDPLGIHGAYHGTQLSPPKTHSVASVKQDLHSDKNCVHSLNGACFLPW
jgi:hypothetical protein